VKRRPLVLFWLWLSAFLLIGCSIASSPPKAEVDKAVDWALGKVIRREDKSKPLFDSYRLMNQYREQRGDETTFVYDFEAECRVVLNPSSFDNYGRTYPAQWVQPTDPRSPEKSQSFKGSVTLVKKGDQWYARQTLR
jgi:hypothetical protein